MKFLVSVGTRGMTLWIKRMYFERSLRQGGCSVCMSVLQPITTWQSRFELACPSGLPDDVGKVSVARAGQDCHPISQRAEEMKVLLPGAPCEYLSWRC